MKKSFILASVTLLLSASGAFAGVGAGGGGDAKTEGRIDEIRADILKWISEGGANALTLREDLSYEQYAHSMANLLPPKFVVVTAIKSDEEKLDDEELNVRVDGQPKTCKGFISKKDGRPHILCNVERFWDGYELDKQKTESEQYRQIHHEFAGLAEVEKNVGAASDYSLSNQITDYLAPEVVMRLAVKPPTSKLLKTHCQVAFGGDLEKSNLFFNGIGKIYTTFENLGRSNPRMPSAHTQKSKRAVKFIKQLIYSMGYVKATEYHPDTLQVSFSAPAVPYKNPPSVNGYQDRNTYFAEIPIVSIGKTQGFRFASVSRKKYTYLSLKEIEEKVRKIVPSCN